MIGKWRRRKGDKHSYVDENWANILRSLNICWQLTNQFIFIYILGSFENWFSAIVAIVILKIRKF